MKNIYVIKITFVCLLICASFISCSDEEDGKVLNQSENVVEDFSQEGNMTFTENAGEQTFSFTTSMPWTIKVASTRNEGATWCSVVPTSGEAGTHTVKVMTLPNESYDDRSVTITLNAGTENKSFVVTQKQKNALLLTSDKFELDQRGGNITVEVKSNVNYTATISESCENWIKENNATRALSTSTKSYTISLNDSGEKREGSIIFSDGTLTETVHVYQSSGSVILLNKNDYYVGASGEDIMVELRSNCDYEVVMPSVDWIKEVLSRSMSSHTLYYAVSANETYDAREAKIIYRDKGNNDIADTLTIRQAQKDAIIVSEKEIKVDYEGGTVEVKIDANVDFEMQLPSVDWIGETSSRGLITHTKFLTIAENTSNSPRTANVIFKNTTSGIEETLVISQSTKGKKVKVYVEKPGTLSDLIPESEKMTIEELEVSGYLGGLDIALICDMAGRDREGWSTDGILKRLDISKATIVGDGEYYVVANWGAPQKVYSYPKDNIIGDHMFANTKLETIILPDNVVEIEHDAFGICQELSQVVIPDGVKSIGEFAFSSTQKLRSITIPSSMNTIEKYAFALADGLEDIVIPGNIKSIEDKAFVDCENLVNIIIESGLENIGSDVFSGCKNLENIVLPESVNSIGERCFSGCDNLSAVQMPVELYAFDQVFYNCQGLRNIVIPEGTMSIGNRFFEYCTNLESIIFPNTLQNIGIGVFNYCSSLSGRIEIPINVTSFGQTFIGCHDITLSIPAKLVCEKENPIYGENMKLELINDGTSSINFRAFSGSAGLVSVTIPDCITSIGEEAFAATGLNEIIIPNSVTIIKNQAFAWCENLTNVSIPNSVNTIESYVFNNCTNLTHINIPNSVISMGRGCFDGCLNLQNITIPGKLLAGEDILSKCTGLMQFIIPEDTEIIGSYCFYECKSLTDIVIPDRVKTIGNCAFYKCTSLVDVTIGRNVSFIDQSAFADVPIKHLYCNAVTPPSLSYSCFNKLDKEAILYVPTGCKTSYLNSDWTKYFDNANIIEYGD